ncbi:hypothetical protein BGZ92_005374 [Podila epicladia]|nr:hypothetical protein BGZ92_005374 [Podila epicladia]
MARRESITSSFATTRTVPPPNISKIARLDVGKLDRTDFKQRIQELKSSLANRQHHVDVAQRATVGQIEHLHRNAGSEDPSVTVTESIVSNSIQHGSTLEQTHEIGHGEEEDNMDSHDILAFMDNNEDDARVDLRSIRDDIHDMLATLERSKMESRQMQQWIVERSDLERQLREEWAATNSEAQRLLTQKQRQIDLASQRTSTHGLHELRASRRHIRTLREQTASREAKESSIDEVELTSDSTIPPPTLAKKRNRTHVLAGQPNRMEFEQDNFSSDASSEYRDPGKPENPVSLGNKATDDGSDGAQPTTNRHGIVGKRFPWRVVRICFWILFTFALHVALMGLLFRPIALVEDGSRSGVAVKNRREHRAHSIRYKGRDYVSGQPGFYTFLSDGFGTDSLAYCHDMVHYPGLEDKSWGSSLLRYTLDAIDHAHAQWVSLSKVCWNGKPLQNKLQPLWSPFADRIKRMMRKKSNDETLDWVFAEHQAQAQ